MDIHQLTGITPAGNPGTGFRHDGVTCAPSNENVYMMFSTEGFRA
jgi:hypothetical protein